MGKTARKRRREFRIRQKAEKELEKSNLLVGSYQPRGIVKIVGIYAVKLSSGVTKAEAKDIFERRFDNTGEIVRLYHGTPEENNFKSIASNGFRMSHRGMFGEGVYFGKQGKASSFARRGGVILECMVALGRVFAPRRAIFPGKNYASEIDTIHGTSVTGLNREEWCVRNLQRIVILSAYLKHIPGIEYGIPRWKRYIAQIRADIQARRQSEFRRRNNIVSPCVQKILSKPKPPGARWKKNLW